MKVIAFLRAVMPTGPNRIPKMKYLVEILSEAGFKNVSTYIQSGNIIFETNISKEETSIAIHDLIKQKIGADLSVVVKTADELRRAVDESPFSSNEDLTCVFIALSNDTAEQGCLKTLQETDFGAQKLFVGKEGIHLWLPWDARPKRLNNTYLEKYLGIVSTMRNLKVVRKICELAELY